jgi:hypothetical protein
MPTVAGVVLFVALALIFTGAAVLCYSNPDATLEWIKGRTRVVIALGKCGIVLLLVALVLTLAWVIS